MLKPKTILVVAIAIIMTRFLGIQKTYQKLEHTQSVSKVLYSQVAPNIDILKPVNGLSFFPQLQVAPPHQKTQLLWLTLLHRLNKVIQLELLLVQ